MIVQNSILYSYDHFGSDFVLPFSNKLFAKRPVIIIQNSVLHSD